MVLQFPGNSCLPELLCGLGRGIPHGSLNLISCRLLCKVWTAWLGFVLERRRKKARLERAMQAYHQRLLREGATRLLRFTTGMKTFRQQLQTQQQVKVSQSYSWGAGRAGQELMRSCVVGSPQPPLCSPPLC